MLSWIIIELQEKQEAKNMFFPILFFFVSHYFNLGIFNKIWDILHINYVIFLKAIYLL